jgi:hypothetical protein
VRRVVEYRDADEHEKSKMPTSHFCNGKWRDGPVSACDRHQKLPKKQTTVYRGVGEPGGKGGAKAPKKKTGRGAGSPKSSLSAPKKPPASSGSDSKES